MAVMPYPDLRDGPGVYHLSGVGGSEVGASRSNTKKNLYQLRELTVRLNVTLVRGHQKVFFYKINVMIFVRLELVWILVNIIWTRV